MSSWCWDEHIQCLFAATIHSSPPLSERIMSDRTGTRWWTSHSRNNDVHHSTLLITFHSTYDLLTTKPQHSFYFENSFYVFSQRNFKTMIDVTPSVYTYCNYWTWMWRVIIFTRVKIAVTLSEGSHQEFNQKWFFLISHF